MTPKCSKNKMKKKEIIMIALLRNLIVLNLIYMSRILEFKKEILLLLPEKRLNNL